MPSLLNRIRLSIRTTQTTRRRRSSTSSSSLSRRQQQQLKKNKSSSVAQHDEQQNVVRLETAAVAAATSSAIDLTEKEPTKLGNKKKNKTNETATKKEFSSSILVGSPQPKLATTIVEDVASPTPRLVVAVVVAEETANGEEVSSPPSPATIVAEETHGEEASSPQPPSPATAWCVDVMAPANLPKGASFEAEIEGQRFLAIVPNDGGVQEGETYTCLMRDLDGNDDDESIGTDSVPTNQVLEGPSLYPLLLAETNNDPTHPPPLSTPTNQPSFIVSDDYCESRSSNISSSPFQYSFPSEVPAKSSWMIGRRVKVKDSIKDPKKRNAVGTVIRWKTKATIEFERDDNGDRFGINLGSIEKFVDVDCSNNTTTSIGCGSGSPAKNKEAERTQAQDDNALVTHKAISDGGSGGNNLRSCDDESNNSPLEYVTNTVRHETSKKKNATTTTDQHSVSTASLAPYQSFSVSDHCDNSSRSFYYKVLSEVPAKSHSLIGRRVKVKDSIKDPKKRNAVGTVIRWKTKATIEIERDDNGDRFGVKLSSIKKFVDMDCTNTTTSIGSGNGCGSGANYKEATRTEARDDNNVALVITEEKRETHREISDGGDHLRSCDEKEILSQEQVVLPTRKIPTRTKILQMSSSRSSLRESVVVPSNDGGSWQVPISSNVARFGNFLVEKVRLKTDSDKNKSSETTFLGHILNNQMLTADAPLNGKRNQKPFDKKVEDAATESSYELVSCKCYNDAEKSFGFIKAKVARLVYAKTHGPGSNSFSVEDHLLRVANLTTLNPRKIVARLELFQSPSNLNLVFLDSSLDLVDIPDRGYVGGGFICEDKLIAVLEKAGMSPTHASRVVAIQVRLFIPSMGIYKGMLVKKRRCITNNDGAAAAPSSIELPWSMKKVLKSSHPQALEGAAILICRNGVFPSAGSAHEYIGRKLDPNLKDPPQKSFKQKIKTPLSDMVFLLWRTMGVPREQCYRYRKESLSPERHNHAWLVGVPDPTNSLPPDTVFVPGMKASQPGEIFVTRSPCYAYEHGRKLSTVTVRPKTMSIEDWDWLNSKLDFGVIIFSNPRPGKKSIPERIANGDLDGDLYLVCWDKEILALLKASPLVDEISYDNGTLSTVPSNPNWFHDAQDILIDAGFSNEMDRLTGKLYKLGEKIADGSESLLKHPDANSYYEAYNQALEFKKHGRPITLPGHLIDKIPANLRHLVVESSDS